LTGNAGNRGQGRTGNGKSQYGDSALRLRSGQNDEPGQTTARVRFVGERDGLLRWCELRRGSFGKLRTGSSRSKDALRITARTGDG